MKILVLAHQEAEDLELWYPIYRLMEEGYAVDIAGPEQGQKFKGKYGVPYETQLSWNEVDPDDYAGLLIPGGWAPDKIRRYENALKIVRSFDYAEKPIGQICHAGWVTISAQILKGRVVTSTPGIKDDMTNAGAKWVNEPVVIDGHIISSRWPQDLPQYMKAYIEVLNSSVK